MNEKEEIPKEAKESTKVEKVETAYKKVKFSYKLANFVAAVIALSWFFEGYRKISESPTVSHIMILVAGTLLTILFLGVHSYWIYIEEKSKGTLMKRIALFEKILAKSKKQEKSQNNEELHG